MLGDSCLACGLHRGCKSPFMSGFGSDNPDIVFVGEGPGEREDEFGQPFVGASGKLLKDSITSVGISLDTVRFTNAVRCRPPDNKTPTNTQIKCCAPYLVNELGAIQPKVVVLLGNTPLKSVLGLNGISAYQGTGYIERDGVKYVAAYHPAYILRQHNSSTQQEWIKSFGDILAALDGVKAERGDDGYQQLFPMSLDELYAMRDELLANLDDLVACDIEGVNKRLLYPGNKLISIALANSHKAWSFPLDHDESWWTSEERVVIIEQVLRPVLTQCRIINHLAKFDTKHIRHFLNIDFEPVGDTIQLSRLVNADALEHGLKRLAGIHVGMLDYDNELAQYVAQHPECDYKHGGNYGNIPLEVLLPYGALDVIATRKLHDKLYPMLTEKQRVLYHEMIMPADYALGRIEEAGFKLDYRIIKRYMAVYEVILESYYAELVKDKHVLKYIQQRLDTAPKNRKGEAKFAFNPNSSFHVADVLYGLKGYDPPAYTKTGKPSVKRDLLKEIVYDNRLAGKHDVFLENYMNWKLISSILSKSFRAMLNIEGDWHSEDGRTRSTYTLGGAKTGRTASAEPNLQNIPTEEKEPGTVLQFLPVKNVFTHTFTGGGLMMIDFSGMELRCISSIAGIRKMIDVFNRGGDVHRYTSSLIYKKTENLITKFERYRGKWCNWSLLYKGNWWTLYRLYRINGLNEDEAKRLVKLYYEAYPELLMYHQDTIRFIQKYGYAESVFGRRLALPNINSSNQTEASDAERTGVNMPIQGVASDVLMCALAILTYFMKERGCRSMVVNTVHDSLALDYHPDEREWLEHKAVDVMENVPEYAKDFMPGMDFSWLKVPLKADVDYGTHYGAHGSYTPVICDNCDSEMVVESNQQLLTLDKSLEYYCAGCGHSSTMGFDPLYYNTDSPRALEVSHALRSRLEERIEVPQYRTPVLR